MAMEHGSEPPQWFPTRLDTNDCDSAIGELVLRGDTALLFAPTGTLGRVPFDYNATLLHAAGGQLLYVRVVKAAAGQDQETRIVEGWREICDEFGLMPGDTAVFNKMDTHDRAFMAIFRDANRNDRLSRYGALDNHRPSSPAFRVDMDRFRRAQGAEGSRGWQAAGAGGGGGERALQRDMTIKEAMDLALECGAREGSDEHYIATRLFVKAENRAMFLTFSTNAGRLQWLKRCYEESRIG